ncbi:hypothetical protein [Streptomyces sp. NPDC057854]|uniref:hypothetical protein n=1 Tax=unclassified Streptomyces TaxID=2593676 RepID=UPI0036A8E25D
MSDVVRVLLLGVIALGTAVVLWCMYRSLRGQIDSLRAEVACLRIERVLGTAKGAPAVDLPSAPRLGTKLIAAGALVGAAATSGAAWVLWG